MPSSIVLSRSCVQYAKCAHQLFHTSTETRRTLVLQNNHKPSLPVSHLMLESSSPAQPADGKPNSARTQSCPWTSGGSKCYTLVVLYVDLTPASLTSFQCCRSACQLGLANLPFPPRCSHGHGNSSAQQPRPEEAWNLFANAAHS